VEHGFVRPPEAPGLGIRLRPEFLTTDDLLVRSTI
jgi:L-alanine-DL-glutamate epimerase-like enolase superfamily enzyme